jgi:hypothetical protein
MSMANSISISTLWGLGRAESIRTMMLALESDNKGRSIPPKTARILIVKCGAPLD